MKVKRKQIEELILLLAPTCHTHLLPQSDLMTVLKHEVLHAVIQSYGGVRRTGPLKPGEVTP